MSKLRTPEQYAKHYERVKRYRATKKGAAKTYEVNRRSILKDIDRARARGNVYSAIKRGELERPKKCERCGLGSNRIEAHHEDYEKQLEVMWLCKQCHVLMHKK